MYPRFSLKDLEDAIEPLASKASTTSLNDDDFCRGVFNLVLGGQCKQKRSALQQFGLIEKEKGEYKATSLSVEIAAEKKDARPPLYKQALRNVESFEKVYRTFGSRKTTKADIATYATKSLGIHFDNREHFADKFLDSALLAEICTEENGSFVIEDWLPLDETKSTEDSDMILVSRSVGEVSKKENHVPTITTSDKVMIELKIDSEMDAKKLDEILTKLREFRLI